MPVPLSYFTIPHPPAVGAPLPRNVCLNLSACAGFNVISTKANGISRKRSGEIP